MDGGRAGAVRLRDGKPVEFISLEEFISPPSPPGGPRSPPIQPLPPTVPPPAGEQCTTPLQRVKTTKIYEVPDMPTRKRAVVLGRDVFLVES